MVTNNRSETPIRVYLLVANRLVRESFVRVFRKRAGLTVAGENQDCAAAVRVLADKPCDVLLLSSVGMLRTITEGGNGAESTAGPKPLLFGMEENHDSFLEAVRLGACGYLLNDASSSEVVAAIRAVARGQADEGGWIFAEGVSVGAPTPFSRKQTDRLAPLPPRRRILIEEFDGAAAASEVQARALAGGLAGVPDKDAIDENPLDASW